MTRTCRRCGTSSSARDDGLPSGWSIDTEDGDIRFLCATCTRANIASIEARLSPEWWEA